MKLLPAFLMLTTLHCYASTIDSAKEIHHLMTALHAKGEFNGSILVAVQGRVVYSNGFGLANFSTGEKFTTATASCIASVTKQFTALCIMMLAEQAELGYDDPVSKHLPHLPDIYDKVSIRHLLTHTSGVFDYEELGKGRPQRLIAAKRSLRFDPGEKYEYSNSNYVLLSEIIEAISGLKFTDFVQKHILDVIGMRRTFMTASARQLSKDIAKGYNQFGKPDDYHEQTVYGDGGMYSTVEDLLLWDQALYTEKLIKQSTLADAFVPAAVRSGRNTYGFGWNVGHGEGGKYIWHTGNTAGFRAYIQRRTDERITIIILTNTGASKRIEIAEAIVNILAGRAYSVPKSSAARKMYSIIRASGIRQAMDLYDSVRQLQDSGGYDFPEADFNLMGYELLYGDRKAGEAIEIFRLNTVAYPRSSNAFDSLGEAYAQNGNTTDAIACYQKALEIDPANDHAARMLKKLK